MTSFSIPTMAAPRLRLPAAWACIVPLLLCSSLLQAQTANSTSLHYRTLGILNTDALPGTLPNRPLYSLGKLYASLATDGKSGEAFLQQWGRIIVGSALPGKQSLSTLDAADVNGTDVGQGAALEYVSPATGTIYGWRPYLPPLEGYGKFSRPEQRSAIVKWMPGAQAPTLIELDNALQFSPRYHLQLRETGAYATGWAEDREGNVYLSAWNSGLFRMNAANELNSLIKASRSSEKPTVPDAATGPALPVQIAPIPAHILCTIRPNKQMLCRNTETGLRADDKLYFEYTSTPIGPLYEYWPHGSNVHAVVHSEDQGGTLYVLVGAGPAYTDPASDEGNHETKWVGQYPNASIPSDDSAGAALLALRVADLRDDGGSPIVFLQSLARSRDGLTTFEASNLAYPSPNAIVEVGDYLYGTTEERLWRYNKTAGAGAAIEHVHEFAKIDTQAKLKNPALFDNLSNNTWRPYGPMVLARDGWLYGTAANRAEGIRHPQTEEYVSVKDYGTIFRIKPGHATVEEDNATFEIVHRMAILEGTHPVGLSTGPVTTQADGSHIQTLFGANQWGGHARANRGEDIDPSRYTPGSQRGGGSLFALDIPIPTMLTLNPAKINAGESAQLEWNTTGLSCRARSSDNSFSGAQGVTGKLRLQPTADGRHTYELDCRDAQGRHYGDAVTLQVGPDQDDGSGAPDDDKNDTGGGGPLAWPLGLMLLALGAGKRAAFSSKRSYRR